MERENGRRTDNGEYDGMKEEQKKRIEKLCDLLKTALVPLDRNIEMLRTEIMSLSPEDQSIELLGAYSNIINFLGNIADLRELPSVSYIPKRNNTTTLDYIGR